MSADFSFDTLPDDWLPDSIGGLFDVQQGKALSPEARGGVSRRPFLRTRNVLWGKLDLADVDTMSFDEGEASRLTLQDRDLLVCEGGEIGRTAIWRNELPGCLYQNHIHRLRRKTDEIDPEFVMYWLQAAFLRLGLYEGIGNRTTIPNLSGARLRVLQVPAPRVGEQVAIANVLSKLHETVENSARRIAAFQDLTAATVEKLFHEGTQGEALKARTHWTNSGGLVRLGGRRACSVSERAAPPCRHVVGPQRALPLSGVWRQRSHGLHAHSVPSGGCGFVTGRGVLSAAERLPRAAAAPSTRRRRASFG